MNDLEREDLDSGVEDMAAYWLVRLSSPDCTPGDRFAFETWKREDPEHERVFTRMQRRNSVADRFVADVRVQELIEQARAETAPGWRRYGRIAAIAATLLLVVGVSAMLSLGGDNNPDAPVLAVVEGYETAIGERSTISLSDGSVVTLNTNSRIEVDYSERQRLVRLVRGQGYFEVAKDIDRPFSVGVGDKQVIALGTVFDVRFDTEDMIQVTLVEGRVQVSNVPDPAAPAEGPVASQYTEGIELKPGEQLIAALDATPQVVVADAMVETSWRTGRLIFEERALEEVVAEMNRYNMQKLVLDDDERLTQMKISGTFKTGRASSFVNALSVIRPLGVERSGPNELTLVWQE